MTDIEEKIVFLIAPPSPQELVPTVILGIPAKAWEYMRDGKTHTFDLTSAGLPVRLMLFGAADHAEVMDMITTGAALGNVPIIYLRGKDWGIK